MVRALPLRPSVLPFERPERTHARIPSACWRIVAATRLNGPSREGKSVAAKEFIRIAKRLAGHEVEAPQGVGFFTRIGRALGLSATPA